MLLAGFQGDRTCGRKTLQKATPSLRWLRDLGSQGRVCTGTGRVTSPVAMLGTVAVQWHLGWSIILRVTEWRVLENEELDTIPWEARNYSKMMQVPPAPQKPAPGLSMWCCCCVHCQNDPCCGQLCSGRMLWDREMGTGGNEVSPRPSHLPSPDLPISTCSRGIFSAFPEKNRLETRL